MRVFGKLHVEKKKNRIAKICGATPKCVTQHNWKTRKRSNNEQKKQNKQKKKNEVIMVKKIENLTKDSNVQIQKFREHQQNKYLKNVIFKVQGKKEKILK